MGDSPRRSGERGTDQHASGLDHAGDTRGGRGYRAVGRNRDHGRDHNQPLNRPRTGRGGCGGADGHRADDAGNGHARATDSITIQYLAKAPATATVKAGTTVTWINRDRDAHTVSAMSGPFHFPMLITGRSYHYTFTIPGRYDYLVYHPPVHDRHRGGDPR